MIYKKELKVAWDLYCFITILGIVMMLSYKAGKDSRHDYCAECGYELMLDNTTYKVEK